MTSSGPRRRFPSNTLGGDRRCQGCGAALAADNSTRLCGRCHREQRDQLRTPPAHLEPGFFETDEFRDAFESQDIGKVFKAYRNHPRHLQLFGKALNQELLGRWLGLTQGQVSRQENGKPEQNIKVLRIYAETLHLPRHRLWFKFPGEHSSDHFDDVDGHGSRSERRELSFENSPMLKDKESYVALVVQAASESAAFGLRHQVSELHASTMEQIEEEVRRLSVDFVSGDPLRTFMRSRRLRDDIFSLLDQRVFPQQERLLYGYAARTCGYLATASSDFYGHYEAAADQCRVARRLSDMADFAELRAWVLGLESAIAFWRGDWNQAASLAERSFELAVTRSGVMRAASMRARALARLGDTESLRAVISASEASAIDGRTDEENGIILFPEINHQRCIGTANLWAGESRKAREQLTRALQAYLVEAPENFAVIATIRADIALSFLIDKDVDGAAEAVAPLLEVDTSRRLEGALRRMRNLRGLLQSGEYLGSVQVGDLTLNIDKFLESAQGLPEDA